MIHFRTLHKQLMLVLIAALSLSFATAATAQPRKGRLKGFNAKRKEQKEKRKDLKEKRKNNRENLKETKSRIKELREKRSAGNLSDDEKKELRKLKRKRVAQGMRKRVLKVRTKANRRKRRRLARTAFVRRWGRKFHKRPRVRKELTKHASRMARLRRIRFLANKNGKEALADRAQKAIGREQMRHMARLKNLKGAK
jgi:hypothetical protein